MSLDFCFIQKRLQTKNVANLNTTEPYYNHNERVIWSLYTNSEVAHAYNISAFNNNIGLLAKDFCYRSRKCNLSLHNMYYYNYMIQKRSRPGLRIVTIITSSDQQFYHAWREFFIKSDR